MGMNVCGEPITEYQSKSGKCELQMLTPEELMEQSEEVRPYFYGYCNDDDWNDRTKNHHQNTYEIIRPQIMKIRLARTYEDEDN